MIQKADNHDKGASGRIHTVMSRRGVVFNHCSQLFQSLIKNFVLELKFLIARSVIN